MVDRNKEAYYGSATITVHFDNRLQWQKWRKYVLKTDWEFDGGNGPYTATLVEKFNCSDDIDHIVRRIVQLIEMGFDVYSCNWKLDHGDVEEYEILNHDGEREILTIDSGTK